MRIITILLTILFSVNFAFAAATDVNITEDTTISNITFGSSETSLKIFSGSAAESFSISSGIFTVTNTGAAFKIGSADSNVKSIKASVSGTAVACAANTTPGTSYLALDTSSSTYSVTPLATTDCTALCATLTGAATYNSFPTCGAATCNSGYHVSGSGSSAACVSTYVGGGGGGGGGGNNTNTTPTQPTTPIITEPVTQNQATAQTTPAADKQFDQIKDDANVIFSSGAALETILAHNNVEMNSALQTANMKKYTDKLTVDIKGLSLDNKYALNNFITYGTITTRKLGEGERAGILSSYKKAYSKLPANNDQWRDCIAIANGRWPGEKSAIAEAKAKSEFKKIYARNAQMNNARDNAAVTIMAYGLRPSNRNTRSEAAAIKIFKGIYKKNPTSAIDWDAVRAISYSGAKR